MTPVSWFPAGRVRFPRAGTCEDPWPVVQGHPRKIDLRIQFPAYGLVQRFSAQFVQRITPRAQVLRQFRSQSLVEGRMFHIHHNAAQLLGGDLIRNPVRLHQGRLRPDGDVSSPVGE